MMRRLVIASLFVLSSLALAEVVQAQPDGSGQPEAIQAQSGGPGRPTDDDVNRVAKQLYCPVCPNTPLDVCETKACVDWRAQIKDQLAAGWTDQQVIDYFVAQYGERVLAEPERRGFSSLVWFLPLMVVALGLVLVWQVLRSWQAAHRRQVVHAGPPPRRPSRPPQLERIERELQELR
jgi:cytochrome c-type biogenesis protein CcmH